MTIDFESSWTKIRRAEVLVAEFELACEDWCSTIDLRVEEDIEDGWFTWTIQPVSATPPMALAVLLGELIYDARSALDHLAWSLVLANGRVPGKHTYFPVCLTPNSWPSARGGQLRGVHPEAVEAIGRWQPVERDPDVPQRDPLATLNEMGLVDKHRSLMLTTTAIQRVHIRGTYTPGDWTEESRSLGIGLPLDVPQTLLRIKAADPATPRPEVRLGENTRAGIEIRTFDPFRIHQPYTMVRDLVAHVATVVGDIEARVTG